MSPTGAPTSLLLRYAGLGNSRKTGSYGDPTAMLGAIADRLRPLARVVLAGR